MSRRILVTGATSFLGRALLREAVEHGHEVVAHARRRTAELESLEVETVLCDVRELAEAPLPARIDAVVNLASGTDGDAETMAAVAVGGVDAVLDVARRRRIPRMVHVSSMSVYPGPVLADHSMPGRRALEPHPHLRGGYAQAKVLAERRLLERVDEDGPEVLIVRPGLVFGTDMKDVLAGTAVRLPLGILVGLGRRRHRVPLLDEGDLARGLVAVLERPPGDGVSVVDLLSGPAPTRQEVIDLYRTLSGQDGPDVWIPGPVAATGALAVDLLRRRPGELRRATRYAVRRLYAFDPGELEWRDAWEEAGMQPAGTPRAAIASALTLDRDSTADGSPTWATPRELLRVAAATAPVAASPVRLVLVGAGRNLDDLHLPAIASLPQLSVGCVVDADPARAESVAARFPGASAVAGIGFLTDETIAGATAVVGTPGFTHAELACELLERGADVIVEKPAAADSDELDRLQATADSTGRTVTVVQNYRLRRAALGLWRFLDGHDVGAPVSARVVFHAPRILLERARWMHEERRSRALLLEMAVHFVDLAVLVGGPLRELEHVAVSRRTRAASTVAVRAAGSLARCPAFELDLDLSGTASRVCLELEFERAACALDFYPDAFRVLPRSASPVDDLAAGARRLGGALGDRLRPRVERKLLRARPHRAIYLEHLRQAQGGAPGPFGLDGVADTLTTLNRLADAVYADPAELDGERWQPSAR